MSKSEYKSLSGGARWPCQSDNVPKKVAGPQSITSIKQVLVESNDLSLKALGLALQEGCVESYPVNFGKLELVRGVDSEIGTNLNIIYGFKRKEVDLQDGQEVAIDDSQGFSIILAEEVLRTCNSSSSFTIAAKNFREYLLGTAEESFLGRTENQKIDLNKLEDVAEVFGVKVIFEQKLEELVKQEKNSKKLGEEVESEHRPPSTIVESKGSDSSLKLSKVQIKDEKVLEILHDLIFAFSIDERWGNTRLSKGDVTALITDLRAESEKGKNAVDKYLEDKQWKANFDGLFQEVCYEQKIANPSSNQALCLEDLTEDFVRKFESSERTSAESVVRL